jgi:dihydrofolate reductase
MKAILAKDDKWGIGLNQSLPWPHNPADMKWFKQTTLNKTVIMGRNTWESLGKYKPLPNRVNIVITSSTDPIEGVDFQYSLEQFEQILTESPAQFNDAWIIGGAQLFHHLIDHVDELRLTNILGDFKCDTFLDSRLIHSKFECAHSSITNPTLPTSLSVDIYKKKN